jgi:hypothetical protein
VLRAFVNAFKVPDLRNKICSPWPSSPSTAGVARPGPGRRHQHPDRRAEAQGSTGFLSFIDLFSGGALTRMAIFGLGIMPYITASIIMQLLTVVIPKLEAWHKEGESGTKKINQWTRYVTVVLALLQSTGPRVPVPLAFGPAGGRRHLPAGTFTAPNIALIVLVMTGRHRDDHVDGRADHPARDRQRDVDPDLLERDLAIASGGTGDPPAGRQREVRRRPVHRARDHRRASSSSSRASDGSPSSTPSAWSAGG